MEWKLGADGKVAWYYDGAFVWSMDAASFGEYQVCAAKPRAARRVSARRRGRCRTSRCRS